MGWALCAVACGRARRIDAAGPTRARSSASRSARSSCCSFRSRAAMRSSFSSIVHDVAAAGRDEHVVRARAAAKLVLFVRGNGGARQHAAALLAVGLLTARSSVRSRRTCSSRSPRARSRAAVVLRARRSLAGPALTAAVAGPACCCTTRWCAPRRQSSTGKIACSARSCCLARIARRLREPRRATPPTRCCWCSRCSRRSGSRSRGRCTGSSGAFCTTGSARRWSSTTCCCSCPGSCARYLIPLVVARMLLREALGAPAAPRAALGAHVRRRQGDEPVAVDVRNGLLQRRQRHVPRIRARDGDRRACSCVGLL